MLIAWLAVAVPTVVFYTLACFGTTHLVAGPVDLWVNTLVSVSWEKSGGLESEFFPWGDPRFQESWESWESWPQAILAEFDFLWDAGFLIEFPLWSPLIVTTLILALLHLLHRRRKAHLPNNQ